MPNATKKTTTRKRTALKNLPAKVKDVTKKDSKRVKGGDSKTGVEYLTYQIRIKG